MKELTLEQKRDIFKRWIPLIYQNDKNNTIFDAYNDYCDKKGKPNLEKNLKNINKIINDKEFIEECINKIENYEELIEDIENWSEEEYE